MTGWHYACIPVLFYRRVLQERKNPVLTPKALRAAMNTAEMTHWRRQYVFLVWQENLLRGTEPQVDGLMIALGVEVSDSSGTPQITIETGFSTLDGISAADSKETNKIKLKRIGDTEVYASGLELSRRRNVRWSYEVGGRTVKGDTEVYSVHPDMVEKAQYAKGQSHPDARMEKQDF